MKVVHKRKLNLHMKCNTEGDCRDPFTHRPSRFPSPAIFQQKNKLRPKEVCDLLKPEHSNLVSISVSLSLSSSA